MTKFTYQKSPYLEDHAWRQFVSSVLGKQSKPKLVVAIARKMPRILEYLQLIHEINCPIVSERALPWLEKTDSDDRHVVFCDDLLNIGSTLLHYLKYAEECHIGPLRACVYAIRANKAEANRWFKNSNIQFNIERVFNEQQYWEFETSLPRDLLAYGKPYDIDFPIIELSAKENTSSTEKEWDKQLSRIFPYVENLTTSAQRAAGISSFTLINPICIQSSVLLNIIQQYTTSPNKIRLYISLLDSKIRLVPMCITSLTDAEIQQICSNLLSTPYSNLVKLCSNACRTKLFPLEPVFNFLNFLISFEYGRLFLTALRTTVSWRVCEPKIDRFDIELLFGNAISEKITYELLNHIVSTNGSATIQHEELTPVYKCSPLKSELALQVLKHLKDNGYGPHDTLGAFCQSMRILDGIYKANDPPTNELPDYSRLRRGLSFRDIHFILSELCKSTTKISAHEVSVLLDFFIDQGVAVPIIEVVDGTYYRTYRCGEASPPEFGEFIHGLLCDFYEMFPNKLLTKTQFTKLISALAIYHGERLSLVRGFHFRGSIPYLGRTAALQWETVRAIDYLLNKGIIEEKTFKDIHDTQNQGRLF